MQTPSRRLTIAALLALAVSVAVPAVAQAQGTVVYASGDDVVVKSADGKLLNYTVPAPTKLKAGEKLTAPLSGTPQVVTAVAVVKGKVYSVTPPTGVTLSLTSGVQDLTVPAGTMFTVDGKKLTLAELKPDMMVEATVVTTAADGASATATPAQSGALLVSKAATDEDLPAAGTNLPLFGAIGLAFLAGGFALLGFRKFAPQV